VWYDILIRIQEGTLERFPGEYRRVYFWSKRKDLIRKTNMTSISKENAISLIRLIEEAYGINNHNAFGNAKIVFKKRTCGFARYSAWTIGLPSKEVPQSYLNPDNYYNIYPCDKLRVGVVLHEMAHLATYKAFRMGKHSRQFVEMFDDILEFWEKQILLDKEMIAC